MWQPYKPYLAQNIAEFVVSLKEDYRLSQKINVFNAKHPEDHVVAGSGEYIHCSDIEQKSVKLDKYDSLINNVLVTRVWHNSNDINVLNEHGNFLYSYMLAINHPHDFHI